MEEASVLEDGAEYQIGAYKHCVERFLGAGTFGQVYSAFRTQIQPAPHGSSVLSDGTVALKLMKSFSVHAFGEDIRSSLASSLGRRMAMTMQLSHDNVVRTYQAGWLNNASWGTIQAVIAMEYCNAGSLEQYLLDDNGRRALSDAAARSCTTDMLQGLQFLHQPDNKLIHTDVKPANVVLTRQNSSLRLLAKLADVDDLVKIYNATTGSAMQEAKGTPRFMAPEMLTCRREEERFKAGRKCDIWSLGCTVIEMIRGSTPFYFTKLGRNGPMVSERENAAEISDFLQYVGLDDGVPLIPNNCSQAQRTFLGLCCKRTPDDRPSAASLLGNAWITTELPLAAGDPWFA